MSEGISGIRLSEGVTTMQPGKGSNIQIHAVGIPTMAEIVKTLEVCLKNPGRLVSLLWSIPEAQREYELTATIPVVRSRVGGAPMPVTSIPELSLTYKTLPAGNTTLIWNQTTADAKIIHHLINREMGGPSKAFVAFDEDENGRVSGNRPAVLGSRPAMRSDMMQSSRTSSSLEAMGSGANGGYVQPIENSQTLPAMTMKLEGNLGEIDLTDLLQSIAMCKMTGCMKVTNDDAAASLFMDKGMPTHAYVVSAKAITAMGAEIEGSDALLEMLLMNDGVFQFHPQQVTHERSVPKPLQMYLLEGAALRDHHSQLFDRGITDDAVFVRAHKNLEYSAFKSKLMEGIPASIPVQKHFYQLSDGKLTLGELLRKQPLKKSDWVPALYNLLQCGLLQLKDNESDDETINWTQETIEKTLELARGAMFDVQTGLIPYPIFLSHMDEEFARYEAKALPFSFATFEIWIQTSAGAQPLNTEQIRAMVEKIHAVTNKYDKLGTFSDGTFALLMPMQEVSAAAVTAQRIMDAMKKTNFAMPPDGAIKVMIGISGVPDIATDLITLLKTAHDAKNVCKKTGANIYTHRNLSSSRN
jgi:GGDEF domain-containing protein